MLGSYMNNQYHVLADQKVIGTCNIDRLSVSNFSHIDSLVAKVSEVRGQMPRTNKHAMYVYGYKTISQASKKSIVTLKTN